MQHRIVGIAVGRKEAAFTFFKAGKDGRSSAHSVRFLNSSDCKESAQAVIRSIEDCKSLFDGNPFEIGLLELTGGYARNADAYRRHLEHMKLHDSLANSLTEFTGKKPVLINAREALMLLGLKGRVAEGRLSMSEMCEKQIDFGVDVSLSQVLVDSWGCAIGLAGRRSLEGFKNNAELIEGLKKEAETEKTLRGLREGLLKAKTNFVTSEMQAVADSRLNLLIERRLQRKVIASVLGTQ